MAINKCIVVVVLVVTFASLGHSRKELSSPGRNTRKDKPSVTQTHEAQSVQVTTEGVSVKNETSNDFEVESTNITDTVNATLTTEADEGDGEEDNETTALSTLPEENEPSIFNWIYGRIMHAIESYSTTETWWDWISGLGGNLAQSRLYDLKFSPLAYEIIDFLEPYGFKPYPDPYEPLYLDKDDIWKFAINWLMTFGYISLFWRSYDLPLPFGLYEKFGIIDGPPGLDVDGDDDEANDEDEEKEEDEEGEGEEEEEEEEEDDGDDEEEEEDPDGGDDEEEEGDDQDEEEEENYYKVGSEEEEEEKPESFAVFRQKDPDGERHDDDDRYLDEEEMDDEEMDDEAMDDDDLDDMLDDGMDSQEGISSYTFYTIPEEEKNGTKVENGMNGDDDQEGEDSSENTQEEQVSSYTSYATSDSNRRSDHIPIPYRRRPQTNNNVRKTSKKTSTSRQRQTKGTKRVQGKHRSSPTARPPRPTQGSFPLRSFPGNRYQRPPPPGVVSFLNSGKRPAFLDTPPNRPRNTLRRMAQPPSSSSSSSSFFPFSWFQ